MQSVKQECPSKVPWEIDKQECPTKCPLKIALHSVFRGRCFVVARSGVTSIRLTFDSVHPKAFLVGMGHYRCSVMREMSADVRGPLLVITSASLLVTSALLVVTMFAINFKLGSLLLGWRLSLLGWKPSLLETRTKRSPCLDCLGHPRRAP